MSFTLNATDPLQLSDLYSRPASKVFPPIQNIRNPSKSSYPDNPLVQLNFRQQNHRIIRSCSLISASKIIARQPPFHQNKTKKRAKLFFHKQPWRVFLYNFCRSAMPGSPACIPAFRSQRLILPYFHSICTGTLAFPGQSAWTHEAVPAP